MNVNDQGPNAENEEPVLRVDVDDPDLDMDEDLYYSYHDELFTGVMVEYYPNEQLAAEVGYRGGRPEGRSRAWYNDGTLKSEHVVENRRVVGTARQWHPNGNLAEERRFRDGSVAEVRQWDEDGVFLEQPPITRGFNIPENPDRAALTERSLRRGIERDQPLPTPLPHIAAVDLRYLDAETLRAAAVVFDADGLVQDAAATADHLLKDAQAFALNFVETLAAVEALRELAAPASVIVCPGHGPNHALDLNLATHLGLVTGKATFGVSELAYTGRYDEPGSQRGAWTDLVEDGAVIGRALRTQEGEQPVFVTYGQRLSLDAAADLTLRLTRHSRLPVVTVAAAAALDAAG